MPQKHLQWFERFVEGHYSGEPEHDEHIRLKKQHSLNVLDEAAMIASGAGLEPDLERTCRLAALYHDTGRFPQYATYGTFRDKISKDHALLGARTLRGLGALDGEPWPVRAVVLGAVAMHNRRVVPARIAPELDTVTRVVRDADKLDIVRIMLEHMQPGGKRSGVVLLDVADEPERYTPAIVEQVRQGRIGDYGLMRYVNDFKLLLLSWVFDLNFRPSRRAFLQRDFTGAIFGLLPRNPELTGLENRIYDHLNT